MAVSLANTMTANCVHAATSAAFNFGSREISPTESKAKASLAAVIEKMLSEGEAKSNMTLSQINKAQKLSQAA